MRIVVVSQPAWPGLHGGVGEQHQSQRPEWEALMRAAQNGDAAAYTQLLHGVVPVLRAMLRGRAPVAQLEDVVQDVLITIHRVRHTYDPARPFLPWLAAIAYRRAVDATRREMRRQQVHEQAMQDMSTVDMAELPEAAMERERAAQYLRQAVRSLPGKQRAAVELVKLQDLSVAEAAALSGQTQGAVKVNVHRALVALRRLLGGAM